MKCGRPVARSLGAAAMLSVCLSAHGYVTYLDRLHIVRDGVTFLDDTFSDGIPPPNTPAFGCAGAPNCYAVTGAFPAGSEAGGKLRFDTALGIVSESAIGDPRVVTQARLLTSRSDDPAEVNAGLKQHRSFTASATYDLAMPGPGDAMQLRFTDLHANAADPGHQTDYLQIQVRGNNQGGADIRFIEQDFNANTIDVLGTMPLDTALNADQIRLTLAHSVANSTQVFASWDYLRAGNVLSSGAFPTAGEIFNGETWTRVDVLVSAVPEPETYALMLAGLALIAGARWSRRTSGDAA
jgi:hypothetical protein